MIGSLIVALLAAQSATAKLTWGITIDNTANLPGIVASLAALRTHPTARLVFDPGMEPADYTSAVKSIRSYANVMGEPVDSFDTALYTTSSYSTRMAAYMDGLGPLVNIWEIGNEVNGDWTGASTETAAKVTAAFSAAQSRHVTTAITLFYSPYYLGTDREMVAWSQTYLPPAVRAGVNYVLVSYYPTSATGPDPEWTTLFVKLATVFPNAKVGFGELGLATPTGALSTNTAAKKLLIERFYTMINPYPGRFIGGFFWWTFYEDAVPKTRDIWPSFYTYIH